MLVPQLQSKCLDALRKICGRQGLLPGSVQIPLFYNRRDAPLYCGGYADVWKGQSDGRDVAVKVLRVYLTSDFKKITSVGSRILSGVFVNDCRDCRGSAKKLLLGRLFDTQTYCPCWE